MSLANGQTVADIVSMPDALQRRAEQEALDKVRFHLEQQDLQLLESLDAFDGDAQSQPPDRLTIPVSSSSERWFWVTSIRKLRSILILSSGSLCR